MNIRNAVLATILPLALSGCNEAINTVKSSRLNYNDNFTIDEAFSNRKVCKNTIWELIKDDRGRELVQYKCDVKGIEDYYEKAKKAEKAEINKLLEGQRYVSEYNVTHAKEQVEKREKFLEEARNTPAKDFDSAKLVSLESLKELMTSESPTKLLDLRHYFRDHSKPAIATMIEDYEREERWIQLNGKSSGVLPQRQATLDYLKKNLRTALIDESKIITQKINEERDRLEAISQKNIKDHLSHSKQELKSAQDYYLQTIEKEEHSRKEFEQKAALEIENLEKRPNVSTVYEFFQWVVKEDEIEIVASGLERVYENGKVEQSKFNPNSIFFRTALSRVYQNKLENFSQMQNIRW